MPRISETALVLGGGNARSAYLAGAYEQLHRQDIRPGEIVGAWYKSAATEQNIYTQARA